MLVRNSIFSEPEHSRGKLGFKPEVEDHVGPEGGEESPGKDLLPAHGLNNPEEISGQAEGQEDIRRP